jgi:tripartite-type tricarboxylate transporter receptor subunit TctC
MKRLRFPAMGLALTLIGTFLPGWCAAADYPVRPIRAIVPFAPGGVVDAVARLWADQVKDDLGTAVIENVGGAGGVIGTRQVARAAPDGYTILFGNTSSMVLTPVLIKDVGYDPLNDFIPVYLIGTSPGGITVNVDVPAKTLQEFNAYAKANASKISYSSAGAGTITHLAGELYKLEINAPQIVHVPHKSAGPAMAELLGGQVQYTTVNINESFLALHRAGKVRIIAITADKRMVSAPEIPTAIEAGMPDMVAEMFHVIYVPKGTPPAIVDRIAGATRTALDNPQFRDRLVKAGFEPTTESGPPLAKAFVEKESVRWLPVIKASGLTAESQ